MKKVLIFLLLGIFMISFTSALTLTDPSTWDDEVEFHETSPNGKYGYYEIADTFLWIFNKKQIKTVELLENDYSVYSAWNIKQIEIFEPTKLFDKTEYFGADKKTDKSNHIKSELQLYRQWINSSEEIEINTSCKSLNFITNETGTKEVCIDWNTEFKIIDTSNWTSWQVYNYGNVQAGLYQTKTIVTRDNQNTGVIDWIDTSEGHQLKEWSTWWNGNWERRREIKVKENTASTLTNYSTLIYIPYDSDMLANFSDLRFIDSTNTEELSYWIENKTDSSFTWVWIKIPTLTASINTTIYMYYNNSLASSNSNIKTTFLIGDDFNDASVDTSIWTTQETPIESSGYLRMSGTTVYEGITSISQFTKPLILKTRSRVSSTLDYSKIAIYSESSIGTALVEGYAYEGANSNTIILKGGAWGGSIIKSITPITWEEFKTIRYSNNTIFSITGASTGYDTQVGTNNNAYISFSNWNGNPGHLDLDYMFLYEWISSEPTYVIGNEELNAGIFTELLSPPDSINFINPLINFSVNSSSIGFTQIDNVTLYIWNADNLSNLIINFTSLNSNTSVVTNWTNILEEGIYIWNAETCGTGVDCSLANLNRTFTIHFTAPTVNVTAPSGLSDYFILGDNETLVYNISEPGENITEHIDSCWYEYNFTNNSLNCSKNEIDFTYIHGINNITVYTNDTFGLMASNTTIWDYTLLELNQTYQEIVKETEFSDFEIYIETAASSIINPKLIYNNISNSATLNSVSENLYYLTSTPLTNISVVGENYFYWNITLDGTEFSTQTLVQNVSDINFSLCGGTNNITYLSVDFRDELTLLPLNATIRTSTFDYYIEDSSASKMYTYSTAGNESSYEFCFDPSTENITMDLSISYYADGYPERTFGTETTLSNQTTNVTLDLLDDSSGLYATFKFIDATTKVGLSGVNVLIYDGTTLVIEKTTDDSGVVSEWLNPNILYEIQYSKTGYDSGSQSIRPVTTETFNIEMISDSAIASPFITNGLITLFYPQTTDLDDDTNYNFGFLVEEGEEEISLMKFTIYDEDRNIILFAEQSGDGNMSQQQINVSQNKTLLVIYELNGIDDGYWKFDRTYYVTVITSTDYSLDQWGTSLNTYFPADDRTTLTKLVWYVLWFILMFGGFTFGYNGSFKTQDDFRTNITAETRSNTSTGLFFAFIITWIFCYFNLVPFIFNYPSTWWGAGGVQWVTQYFLAIILLIPLVVSFRSAIGKWNRRGN